MNKIGIGHNQPNMATTAAEVTMDLSAWLSEHPVIQTEEEAREAKLLSDRSKLCVADLEDERKAKTIPLNEQVKKINDHYREPRSLLEKVLDVLQDRLSIFLRAEEKRRIEAAQEAARVAQYAEQRAREAEQLEQDAIRSAESGELGIDVAPLVVAADSTFRDFERASHQKAIAERETKVKIGGGFRRSASLRSFDLLTIIDPVAAIQEMGVNERILGEIRSAARAYNKLKGHYPAGIEVKTERKV